MDKQQHLYDMLKDFKTGMLITRAGETFHARPMAVAELKPDADAYFATSIESPKVKEIEADPKAMITFQGSSQFAYLQGTMTVVRDRALIDRLWQEMWRAWFPGGKDDPSLCLLKFTSTEAEYWDNSGAKGLRYAFEGLKAILSGTKASATADQHAKIKT